MQSARTPVTEVSLRTTRANGIGELGEKDHFGNHQRGEEQEQPELEGSAQDAAKLRILPSAEETVKKANGGENKNGQDQFLVARTK